MTDNFSDRQNDLNKNAVSEAFGDNSDIEKITGSIENVIYSNEDNGYSICDMGTDENELITIVGTMPYVGEGDRLTVYGKWIHNPKYGRQFKVESYEKNLPADANSILRYLSSRAIRGIGPRMAQKIVDEFGDETFDVIENHPDWLAQIPGISRKKAEEIAEDFRKKSGIRSAMMFFREWFGAATTTKIYNKWGNKAIELAKHNPYLLCEEIVGIGFEKSDSMAVSLGLPLNSTDRIMSGVKYMLIHNANNNGHVCLPREKLVSGSARLLGVDEAVLDSAVGELLKKGELKYSLFDGEQYIYDRYSYESERYIAQKLYFLDKSCATIDATNVNLFIEREERTYGISYASLQRKAISDALLNGVMVLTGGPGTGKTTVVRALLDIFDSMGLKVALSAPTGRAAKRMSEATSSNAKTIHRLLEMSYAGDGVKTARFGRDEDNLLGEDVIIVDEASMIDNSLMCSLLKAVKPGARIIIIGDADQLPSVGAGNVLRDIIESGRFATVCLNEIFRQAQQSLIVTNAHAINEGRMPELSVKNNDFFFLERNSDEEIAYTIADLCKNRLPKAYGAKTENGIQVITPSRKGEASTENLNIILQRSLNPAKTGKSEYKFRDKVFREGDRVMQIRNNYDIEWERSESDKGMGIFNGDIGIILQIDVYNRVMRIDFDERIVQYDFDNLEELEHAYAITVHKSQGSEYPFVIIPMYSAPPMLLTRNLLYTAVTRAQHMVILVGRQDIVCTMVENNRQSMRYTGLCRRLAMPDGASD